MSGLRFVLGASPHDFQWVVLLSEGEALTYLDRCTPIDDAFGATTMREFFDQLDDDAREIYLDAVDDDEAAALDRSFDPELVTELLGEYAMYPDVRATMLDDIESGGIDLDLLEDRVVIVDSMGSDPGAFVLDEDVDEVRRRLTAAGHEVIGWDELT